MTDLVNGAILLLEEHNPNEVAPGFTERLEVAARGGADGPTERTIAAPYYLTDLGVRRFEDPALFYQCHLERFNWTTRISNVATSELLLQTHIKNLAGLLDACVLLLGNYDLARTVVTARFEEILLDGDFDSQVYTGVILAAHGDEACRGAFDAAAHQEHTGAVHRFMAHHRLAATEIKRFACPKQGIKILDDIDRSMRCARDNNEISEGDRLAMESVTANLRALAFLGLRDFSGAKLEVERARQISTVDDLVKVKPGEAARYAAQESINIAQLLAMGTDTANAVVTLEQNVEFCHEHCPEYLGEALSALAYAHFLAHDYTKAIETAEKAIVRVSQEGSPQRLRAVREILIGALAESGQRVQASRQLELLETDPLGLNVSRGMGQHENEQVKL